MKGEDKKDAKDDDTMDASVTELINSYMPRIGNDIVTIMNWTAKAKKDIVKTTAELEKLPFDAKSPIMDILQKQTVKDKAAKVRPAYAKEAPMKF
jgi:hypothetical protein